MTETIEQSISYLQLGHLAVKVTVYDAFAEQFPTSHFGFDDVEHATRWLVEIGCCAETLRR